MKEKANDSLPIGTELQQGKFIIDNLFSDKGGFSLIYEGRAIRKVVDEFFGGKRENLIEESVIIKELYFEDKSERKLNSTQLLWKPKNDADRRLIEKFKEKTKSEGMKLAELANQTPYIIVILAAFEENDTVYLVTKKIEGAVDFGKIVRQESNPLQLKNTLRYIVQVCEALKVVHNNNIIHLDIKPDNILRDSNDNAILIDFGISVSVVEGKVQTLLEGAVSPGYSPPEQETRNKNNIGFYSDIYSLGATMYFLFTKKNPPSYGELINEPLLPPSYYNKEVSDYLDEVIVKCMQIKFQNRYQTVDDLLEALNGEATYNRLVEKAKKSFQEKRYDLGIEAIVASEKYIPLTMDLHSLKLDLQNARKQSQKEANYKQQLNKAEQLITTKNYQEAVELLQLLPENDQITKKILYCEEQLKKEKLNELLKNAAFYEKSDDYEKALTTYLEAKKIDQNNKELNTKIEKLKSKITQQNDVAKIRESLSCYETGIISYEEIKPMVIAFLEKYPKEINLKREWKTIEQVELQKQEEQKYLSYLSLAEKAVTYREAHSYLSKIPKSSKHFYKAQQVIKKFSAVEDEKNILYQIEQFHKNILSYERLQEEVGIFTKKYPYNRNVFSKFQVIKQAKETYEQEKIKQIKYEKTILTAKTLIRDKKINEAQTILLNIPENAESYQEAKNILKEIEVGGKESNANEQKTKNNTGKVAGIVIALSLLVFGGYYISTQNSIQESPIVNPLQTNNEQQDWEQLQSKPNPTVADYQTFISTYPNGTYTQQATTKKEELEKAIQRKQEAENKEAEREKIAKADTNAWNKARQTNTKTAYKNYLRAYPNGIYKQKAKTAIAKIEQQEQADKQAAQQRQIANYETQANRYKQNNEYILAIQKLNAAQNIKYSSSRNTKIRNLKAEGDSKARQLMRQVFQLKIDSGLDDCNNVLKRYYKKVRKLTKNRQVLTMIKCND